MEQAKGVLIKFIVSLIAFWIALDLFFDASISDVVTFALTATAISYILADRILLPRIGKTNTLMAEFILLYMIVWVFGSILLNGYLQVAWGSIISASIIIAGEVFVHQYLLKHMPKRKTVQRHHRRYRQPSLRYATEFAEEKDPRDNKKK